MSDDQTQTQPKSPKLAITWLTPLLLMLISVTHPAQSQATPQQDPNFVGKGDNGFVSWYVDEHGTPVVHNFHVGYLIYLGYDSSGVSYFRATSNDATVGGTEPIRAYRFDRIQKLPATPPNLLKPVPPADGLKGRDLALAYAKAYPADASFNGTRQFTPRPQDPQYDPNFYGRGESRLFYWGGEDEGRPRIYSTTYGEVTYLGFDQATGISYIQIPYNKQFMSYKATLPLNPGVAVASVPANLSQPPSKMLKLDAAARQLLLDWQKTSGPNKDPNFWGDGEDRFFIWYDQSRSGIPRLNYRESGGVLYLGFDETTGLSYVSLGSSINFFTYKMAGGRPIPASGLPSHLSNVPPNEQNLLRSITTTTIKPAAPSTNIVNSSASVAHTGNDWTVTFVDDEGKKQTLPMTRPNLAGFTPQTWDDLNKNHAGLGMWFAALPGGEKYRIIDVRATGAIGKMHVDSVVVGLPATMPETIAFLAKMGVVVVQ